MGERPVSSWDAQGLVWPPPSPLPQVSIQKNVFRMDPVPTFQEQHWIVLYLQACFRFPGEFLGFWVGFCVFFFVATIYGYTPLAISGTLFLYC